MSEDQGNPTPIAKPIVPPTELISAAFAKAQGQFKQPELNRTAKITKEGKLLYETQYADLNQCIECIRKALSDNGLSFTQTTEPSSSGWLLVLTLRHESGQTLKSFLPINVTGSPQVIGGQLTYFKRYQISAFFGLAADFDDDGNAGTGNAGEFGDKKPKGKNGQATANQSKTASNSKASNEPAKPEQGPVSPAQYVLPKWGGSNQGKKLGDIDTPTLEKLRDHMKGQLTAKPKPAHISEIATAYAHVKAVLVDRMPPPPDDIPENINPKTGEFHPEDEGQPFPPDETEPAGPTIDDFMIPKGVLEALDPIAGIPLKQISEKELRAAQKILDEEMKKGPKGKITAAAGFELRNKITEFFNSMGG